MSQSLFYWIIYSYEFWKEFLNNCVYRLNPYFTGLSILIFGIYDGQRIYRAGLNPYFTGLSILILLTCNCQKKILKVSILILLDYLFLYDGVHQIKSDDYRLNPYFTGLSILIRSVKKAFYLLLLQNFFQTLKSSFFRFF